MDIELIRKGELKALAGANLEDEDLAGANLSGSNLAGAKLVGTDLKGANLERAYLEVVRICGPVSGVPTSCRRIWYELICAVPVCAVPI
jgi:Pentapeptide repeats (8 copies)